MARINHHATKPVCLQHLPAALATPTAPERRNPLKREEDQEEEEEEEEN